MDAYDKLCAEFPKWRFEYDSHYEEVRISAERPIPMRDPKNQCACAEMTLYFKVYGELDGDGNLNDDYPIACVAETMRQFCARNFPKMEGK